MNLLDSVTSKLQGATKESAAVVSWSNPAGIRFVFTLLPKEPVIGDFPSDEAVLVEFEGRSGMVGYCQLIQQEGRQVKVFHTTPADVEAMPWEHFYYRIQEYNPE